MKIGEFIKIQRLARKLSQQKLGELTGYSKSYICRIENGSTHPSYKTLESFAKAFDMPINELLCIEYHVPDEDAAAERIKTIALMLPEDVKNNLLNFLESTYTNMK